MFTFTSSNMSTRMMWQYLCAGRTASGAKQPFEVSLNSRKSLGCQGGHFPLVCSGSQRHVRRNHDRTRCKMLTRERPSFRSVDRCAIGLCMRLQRRQIGFEYLTTTRTARSISADGCTSLARRRRRWVHSLLPNSWLAASPIRPNLIYDRHKGLTTPPAPTPRRRS
jgi:hypothetical protein